MTAATNHARVRRARRHLIMGMAAAAAVFIFGLPGLASAQASAQASNGVALVNRLQTMQAQIQQLQGQVEELQHKLQLLKQADEARYAALEAKTGELGPATPAAGSSSAPTTSAAAPASGAPTRRTPPALASHHPLDKKAAQKAYDAAFKTLRGGDYVSSAREFRAFIQQYQGSTLVPNAYYWLGESYYVTQNFKPALATFQELVQKYPNSRKTPAGKLKVGFCQAELKDYAAARSTLQAVVKAYPGTHVEALAKNRLQALPPAGGGH